MANLARVRSTKRTVKLNLAALWAFKTPIRSISIIHKRSQKMLATLLPAPRSSWWVHNGHSRNLQGITGARFGKYHMGRSSWTRLYSTSNRRIACRPVLKTDRPNNIKCNKINQTTRIVNNTWLKTRITSRTNQTSFQAANRRCLSAAIHPRSTREPWTQTMTTRWFRSQKLKMCPITKQRCRILAKQVGPPRPSRKAKRGFTWAATTSSTRKQTQPSLEMGPHNLSHNLVRIIASWASKAKCSSIIIKWCSNRYTFKTSRATREGNQTAVTLGWARMKWTSCRPKIGRASSQISRRKLNQKQPSKKWAAMPRS